MDYKMLVIFSKPTNLIQFMDHAQEYQCASQNTLDNLRKHYAKERNVSLILQVKFTDTDHKTMCRIKCPINPLPVKGWFEVPTLSILKKFLRDQGWVEAQTISAELLDFGDCGQLTHSR